MTIAERTMATFYLFFSKNLFIDKECYPMTQSRLQTLLEDFFHIAADSSIPIQLLN